MQPYYPYQTQAAYGYPPSAQLPYGYPGAGQLPYGYPLAGQTPYDYPGHTPPGGYGSFPGTVTGGVPPTPAGATIYTGAPTTAPAPGTTVPGLLPMEESYIENILRLNLGKVATIYMTFENNTQWNAKIFRGVLEAAGKDHIIISDPQTGTRYLLLMVNLDYITFTEELNYAYPLQPVPR